MTKPNGAIFFTTLLLCLILHTPFAIAVEYAVGEATGWGPNVEAWTNDKQFKIGDTLVFKYDPKLHNVAFVTQVSYDTCTLGTGSKVYDSGNDRITVVKGWNYFISGVLRDCNNKTKIQLSAWS